MMSQHTVSSINLYSRIREAVAAGIMLLLVNGCGGTPPAPAVKTIPEPVDMTVHITVKDEQGRPVKDALVFTVSRERSAPSSGKAVIVVARNAFQPFVLPVQVGTTITFKNRDRVQHHIYSISAAKKIDSLLNRGRSSAPIKLQKTGIVVLGCAIHDRMVGYVYVLDSQHFSLTGSEGTAALAGIPYRAVDIRLWHPSMTSAADEITRRIFPSPDGRVNVEFIVPLRSRAVHSLSPPKSPSKQR